MGKEPDLKTALSSGLSSALSSKSNSNLKMIRGGAALSLGAMLVLLLFRRWRLARWAAGLAAAFVEQWRETHLGANVREMLAKSGRKS